ncbi:hypothetical protein FAVG1_13002 [Fusarium avenaceum]|nr:hypothetical protein FAVG1_13002 [Fusarium avenaceum]
MTDRSIHKFLADPDKKRHDFGARTTAKREYLNTVWPGYLPTDVNDAYRLSGMPFKVIDNIAEIMQLIQACDAYFDIDSLWAAGGLYIACKVKKRIVALVKDGGVDALGAAQSQSAPDVEEPPAVFASPSDFDEMDMDFTLASHAATEPDLDNDKKRKRSISPIHSTKAQCLTTTPSLTTAKILHQLRNDMRLTDDVLNHSADVPSALYISSDTRLICFPIHHAPDHWSLGVLEPVSHGFFSSHYDSMSEAQRSKAVSERKCPVQDNGWSDGVHVVLSLITVLQGNSFPGDIDIHAEKAALVQRLRTIDCSNGYTQEEASAIKGLDHVLDEEARIDLEHRLFIITVEELERRLVAAKGIRHQAQLDEHAATMEVTKLRGKMEARNELRDEIENSLARMQQTLTQHASDVFRASSGVFIHESLSTADGPHDMGLMTQLDRTAKMRLKRDQTSDRKGVRTGAHWMAESLQRTTDELEAAIAAATATLAETRAALYMAWRAARMQSRARRTRTGRRRRLRRWPCWRWR